MNRRVTRLLSHKGCQAVMAVTRGRIVFAVPRQAEVSDVDDTTKSSNGEGLMRGRKSPAVIAA